MSIDTVQTYLISNAGFIVVILALLAFNFKEKIPGLSSLIQKRTENGVSDEIELFNELKNAEPRALTMFAKGLVYVNMQTLGSALDNLSTQELIDIFKQIKKYYEFADMNTETVGVLTPAQEQKVFKLFEMAGAN